MKTKNYFVTNKKFKMNIFLIKVNKTFLSVDFKCEAIF